MADVLYFNGRFTTTDEPLVRVEDRGLQFGDSLYEVIKFLDSKARFARGHWERLVRGMDFLEIPHPWPDWNAFGKTVQDVLDRTEFDDGILYVQVTRGVSERLHFSQAEMTPTAIVYSRTLKFPDEDAKRKGVGGHVSEDLRWKHCDIKTVNLLPNVISKRNAVRAGASEAVMIDDGFVTEGAISNLFLIRDGQIVTHPADHQILPGIVRNRVIELARELGIPIEERAVPETELSSFEEVFLTSTTQGVMPMTSIDGEPVGEGTIGPITEKLQTAFDELEHSDDAVDAIS
ncbi:MAG: aminotransferase class IV [Thermoanaerobaculia bacterium]|nr:aminotransferase class IV [Thermoanaerobaculia bacterium]